MTTAIPSVFEIVEDLKKSPMFQLSLASRELFHSNFLAWLAENYPEVGSAIFSQYLPQPVTSPNSIIAIRESKNIDILLKFADGQQLVIENKVKSVPYIQQLQDYTLSIPNKDRPRTGFLLITLGPPPFSTDNFTFSLEDGTLWRFADYRSLADSLNCSLPLISNTYHQDITRDYIQFICRLSDLHGAFSTDKATHFYPDKEANKLLKSIRLHDMADKLRFSEMAYRVEQRLKNCGFADVTRSNFPNGPVEQISVCSGMTRSEGLFDLKFVLDQVNGDPVILGVQVQGHRFKLVVEMKSNKTISERFARALLSATTSSTHWFNFALVPGTGSEFPKIRDELNKYSNTFWYRYKILDQISPSELENVILAYVSWIRENVQSLRQTLTSVTY